MTRKKKQLVEKLSRAVDRAQELLNEDFISASKFCARAQKKGSDLIFDNGFVIRTKPATWLGKHKNFYDVYDAKTGAKHGEDLGLFISAMALVKINSTKRTTRILDSQQIVSTDERYQHHLNDAALFSLKLKKNSIDSFKRDFYTIRMEEAMLRCKSAKHELLSFV